MNKKAVAAVIIVIATLAVAYFYLSGTEYEVRLSELDIRQKLEEKLPLTKTYLLIVQVTLDNPRVHLEEGSSRVAVGMDVMFNVTINKNPNPLGAKVDASGGIIYLAETGQFFLVEPEIENLEIQGIPQEYIEKVNLALSKALEEYYRDHPIYTLRSTDVKQAAARMVLKNVTVENKELVVTLGI